MLALLALFVPNTLFWAAYEQMGNTIILWADAYTDRSLDPLHLFGGARRSRRRGFSPSIRS